MRTVVYTVMVVTFEFVLGLATALLFNALGHQVPDLAYRCSSTRLMIAPVVAGLLWRFLLIDNFGIVNELLARIGILDDPNQIGWLSNPDIVLFSVAIPDIWLTTSFMTLVLFAGLQNHPGDVIEAARLDGAGGWRLLGPHHAAAAAPGDRGRPDRPRRRRRQSLRHDPDPDQRRAAEQASTTLSLLIYQTMVRFGEPGLGRGDELVYMMVMLVVAIVAITHHLAAREGVDDAPVRAQRRRTGRPSAAMGAAWSIIVLAYAFPFVYLAADILQDRRSTRSRCRRR